RQSRWYCRNRWESRSVPNFIREPAVNRQRAFCFYGHWGSGKGAGRSGARQRADAIRPYGMGDFQAERRSWSILPSRRVSGVELPSWSLPRSWPILTSHPSWFKHQTSFPSNPIPNNIKSQIVKIELVHLKFYSHFYCTIILTKCKL